MHELTPLAPGDEATDRGWLAKKKPGARATGASEPVFGLSRSGQRIDPWQKSPGSGQLQSWLAGGNSGQAGMDDVLLPAPPLDADAALDPDPPLDP